MKKILMGLFSLVFILLLGGCKKQEEMQVANPVEAVKDAQVVYDKTQILLSIPESATEASYAVFGKTVGEVRFSYKGHILTLRSQLTDSLKDISGLYYEYEKEVEGVVQEQVYTIQFIPGEVGLISWYDEAQKRSNTLSVDTGASEEELKALAELIVVLNLKSFF